MRVEVDRLERVLLAAGLVTAAATLITAAWWPTSVLTAWLGAAVAFAAIPAGALLLVVMMRLIPGVWGEQLRLAGEAATLLTPAAAALFLPVLIGMGAIYPWFAHRAGLTGFQQAWLAPVPFVMVTVARFLLTWWLGRRLRRHRAGAAIAAAGSLVLPVAAFLVAVDWLMSLNPHLASSAFGLQFLLREVTIAFCAMLLLRLSVGRRPSRPGVLGGLMLALLLLWAYLTFLPFFVVWSSNLPPGVGWYRHRSGPGWSVAEWSFAVLGGVPTILLLFAPVRSGRGWLLASAASVLVGKLVEIAWLALPGRGAAGLIAYAAAVIGLGSLATAMLRIALRRRIGDRLPGGARA